MMLGLLKGSGELVQSLDQLLQLGRWWRGLGRSNILHTGWIWAALFSEFWQIC